MPVIQSKYLKLTPQIGKNKHQKQILELWNIIFELIGVNIFSNLKFKNHV